MGTNAKAPVTCLTLGDLREDRYHQLNGQCQRCRRIVKLDLERVISILDEDFPQLLLHWKLRCTVCDKGKGPLRLDPSRDKPVCRYFFSSVYAKDMGSGAIVPGQSRG